MLHSIINSVQGNCSIDSNIANINPLAALAMSNDDNSACAWSTCNTNTINKGNDMLYHGSMLSVCATKCAIKTPVWHGIGRYILMLVVALVG